MIIAYFSDNNRETDYNYTTVLYPSESEQWAADGSFKAEPGQEIEETVYNELFNVLPPLPLPIETAANYEATLYRVKLDNGRAISRETIYTPQFL